MRFDLLFPYLKHFIEPLGITIGVTLATAVVAFFIGIIVAVARTSDIRILSWSAAFYVYVVRGTPLLVQLFLIFYGLPSLGLDIPALPAGILALAIYTGAYMAESMRGGINSISRGNTEASYALGFNYLQTMSYVVLPQALRNMLPALSNDFVVLLKNTSLLSTIAIVEMTQMANSVRSVNFASLETFLFIAILYLVLTLIANAAFGRLERKLGFGKLN